MNFFKYFTCILAIFLVTNPSANAISSNTYPVSTQYPYQQNSLIQTNNTSTDALREIITDMKYQLISAQNEIEKLQESNYNLKKSLSEQNDQMEIIKKEKLILEKTIDIKEKQIQEISLKNNDKLSNDIVIKDNEINKLNNLVANYKQKVEDLSLKITKINNELYKAKDSYLTYSQTHEQLLKEKNELQNNYLNLQSKINLLEKEKMITQQSNNQQNTYLKAIEYLKEDKNSAAIFYSNLAKVYQDNKEFKLAIENYKLAVSINPDYGKAYRELGLIYAETGKYQEALSSLNTYLKYINNSKEEELVRSFISKIERII